MSSNDKRMIVMVKLTILKKNQTNNIAAPNVIKYFNTVFHSQDTGSRITSLIKIYIYTK